MRCAWCRRPLDDVHGHGACLNSGCPMFGLNQAECCSGEMADGEWVAASDVAAPDVAAPGAPVPVAPEPEPRGVKPSDTRSCPPRPTDAGQQQPPTRGGA